jgi:protein-disulfide isomerase
MNRFTSTIIGLAALGALLCGLLVFLHYYPSLSTRYFCSGTILGNCSTASGSSYAMVFGLPLPAYGLFFYLVVWCTMVFADIARGPYRTLAFLLLFPLVIFAVVLDLPLLFLLIKLRLFCFLCILSYGINLSLLATFLLWRQSLVTGEAFSLQTAKRLLKAQWKTPPQKAISTCYLLCIVALAFVVVSTTCILKVKSASSRLSQAQVDTELQVFYSTKVQAIAFPPSQLTVGSQHARVKLIAFTDFLCPPCRRLFVIDKNLLQKYGSDLSIVYYNYPLDTACNPYVSQSSHPYSCVASKAVLSSAELGVFEPYLNKLADTNSSPTVEFSKDTAQDLSAGLTDRADFANQMDGTSTNELLRRDIDLAERLKIRSTPTLFIAGRRIEGIPPQEVMEAIIDSELTGQTQGMK